MLGRSQLLDTAGRLQFDSSLNALVYLSEAGAWQKLWNKFYCRLHAARDHQPPHVTPPRYCSVCSLLLHITIAILSL